MTLWKRGVLTGSRRITWRRLQKTAADVADRIASGKYLFNPTYQECEIIVELVSEAICKCKDE